ncbi:hypothetical protein Y1Q_0013165 [Alligator mississippiensis]|uniref:Uncharacterized protein n=1 Tax=Alligator mississippiensis TaxID=8496 RepID=A0A151MYN3_ALLMI|nr:hypothetical protein Y1Q_0013165 [Alligator mississippiensis]
MEAPAGPGTARHGQSTEPVCAGPQRRRKPGHPAVSPQPDRGMSHGTGERQAISGWTHHPVLPGPQLLPQERQATEHGAARYEAAPAQEAVEREAFKAAEKEAVESEASDAMEREALESEALASKASASSGSFG